MSIAQKDEKRLIETIDKDGNPITLYLKEPDYNITRMCDIEYKKAWTFCFQEGVKTHAKLREMFQESGEWTEDNDRELNELNVNIAVKTVLLAKSQKNNNEKLAQDLALEIMELRNKAMGLSERKQQPLQYSCENAANEIRMEAYVAYATVYADDEDRRYFENYKDFTERRGEQAALDAYNTYLQIVLQENSEYIRGLPENRFLMESGLLDENMNVVKKKSKPKQTTKKKTKKKATKKKAAPRKKKKKSTKKKKG